MNSVNSKTCKSHVLILNLTDKIDLRRGEKKCYFIKSQNTWKNIKSLQSNNTFKISPPTWNDKFEVPDGSHSVSCIQDYFKYILKRHREYISNP